MKRFVESLRERVANARSDVDKTNGGSGLSRARLMLQMVVDLKNNKRVVGRRRPAARAAHEGEDQWGFPITLSRALKADAGVGDASVALRTLTYDKLEKTRPRCEASGGFPGGARGAWFAARKPRARRTRASAAAESAAARGRARVRRSCARPRPCA